MWNLLMFLNADIFNDYKDERNSEFDAGSAKANVANVANWGENVTVKSQVTIERKNKLAQQQRILRKRQTQRQSLALSNLNKSSVLEHGSSAIDNVNLLMMEASSDSTDNNSRETVENYNPAQQKNPAVAVTSITDFKNKGDTASIYRFVSKPCPKDFIIRCKIVRSKTGLYSTYRLYLKDSSKVLMAAKRSQLLKTSNYCISLEEDFIPSKSTDSVICKLYSNFIGTEFKLCENRNSGLHSKDSSDHCRRELAVALYRRSGKTSRCPRKMIVLLPKLDEKNHLKVFEPPLTEGILECFNSGKFQNISVCMNRPPTWNEQMGAYVLNFRGRVTKSSVKNFQMVYANDDSKVLLQFGRTGNNDFTMDLQYPITPVQAFGICLSTFDYKMAVE